MEQTATSGTYTPYQHPKFACRRFARQIWQENPKLTVAEMRERYEIKQVACGGYEHPEHELNSWVLPDPDASQEFDRYSKLPLWWVAEASALWLNLNPFIVRTAALSSNASFWHAAFHPSSREELYRLLEKSERAALSGQLPTVKSDDGQYCVAPKDFYNWAVRYSGQEPAYNAKKYFEELKLEWDKADESRKENKVDLKLKEIRSIFDRMKAADPQFDSSSMPGRKEDFHKLCKQLNKPMFSVAPDTFNDYLKGVCKFNPGARETDYYTKLAHKLG